MSQEREARKKVEEIVWNSDPGDKDDEEGRIWEIFQVVWQIKVGKIVGRVQKESGS